MAGADGSRAVITTRDEAIDSMLVSVVDTATGARIGSTVRVVGQGGGVQLVSGGNRALIVVGQRNLFTGAERTRLVTIDTTTGRTVGSTVTLAGEVYSAQLLSPTSSRALITVSEWNGLTYKATTRMSVYDMATGKQVGATITVPGEVSAQTTFSPDGTRAVLTTANPIPFAVATTGRVAVLRIV